jgi:hypothetical protein
MRQRGSRSAPERYDSWMRASMYASLAVLPAPALLAAAGGLVRPAGLAAFVLLAAAQAAITIALLRASLSHYLARGPKPKPGLVAAGLDVSVQRPGPGPALRAPRPGAASGHLPRAAARWTSRSGGAYARFLSASRAPRVRWQAALLAAVCW